MSWETTYDDRYAEMAAVVADQWEMNPELCGQNDYQQQLDAVREELLELSRVIQGEGRTNPDLVGEELADVLITVHMLAQQVGVEPWTFYRNKQKYNMQKSGDRGVHGKVVDDV